MGDFSDDIFAATQTEKDIISSTTDAPHVKSETLTKGQISIVNPTTGKVLHMEKRTVQFLLTGHSYSSTRTTILQIQRLEDELTHKTSQLPRYGDRIISDGNPAEQLWVDKYAPSKFTELLSGDKSNVEVLKWVNRWREPGGPDKKIMIISGPPGLGKTTLVHVIAKVAGYSILEINASDERTGEGVRDKIGEALWANSLQAQPRLVLIDEIDGAAGGEADTSLIRFLVELTARSSAKPSAATENDEPIDETKQAEAEEEEKMTKRPKAKAASSRRGLCRPIICICNNLYAPALKSLRQVAEVVHIRRPGAVDLAKRLRTICEAEGFKIDNRSLADLCDLMEGDVRACLHALQFMSTTRTQLTTAAEVARNLSQGLKDIGRSDMALTQRIFQQHGRQDSGTRQHELELMLRQASSDLDRVIESCHELFLHTRFFDDSQMTKINTMYDWFLAGDIWAGARHEWSLMGYSLYLPVKASQLFSSPSYTSNASHSSLAWKFRNLERRNQDLVRDYVRSIACCTLTGRTWALLERAPLLLQIIRPSIRSPNPQLLKPSEKLALSRLVQIMATENLSYLEERLEDGTYRMTLDPPIDILTGFAALQNVSPHETAVRKLIAHQVRQERIRRSQPAASTEKQLQSPSNIPAKRKELSLPKKAVKKDFFGRIISVIEDDLPSTDASKPVIQKPAISYRFNEGFSSAVRRTIRIKELFSSV